MLDSVIILILIVLSFVAGKKISDSYNDRIIRELQYQIRKTDVMSGIGYVSHPVQKQTVPIGQEFMDRLKETGHATQSLRSPRR